MKYEDLRHKNLTEKENNKKKLESTTEVNFRLDEPRRTVSFKCNRKLWKTFVSTIKAQKLSVCHVLEPMILGYLTAKVYLSHTIKPLRIENLVVERAVKRVRRYAEEIEVVEGERCTFCGNRSVGEFAYLKTGKLYPLCGFHVDELVGKGNWGVK
jgi:hypothetical protein